MKKTYLDIRIANYSGDIKDLARRHSDGFSHYPGIMEGFHKYELTRKEGAEEYLTLISSADSLSYVMLAVAGPRGERVHELMKEFVEDIGIETETLPEQLIENVEQSLKVLEMASNRHSN